MLFRSINAVDGGTDGHRFHTGGDKAIGQRDGARSSTEGNGLAKRAVAGVLNDQAVDSILRAIIASQNGDGARVDSVPIRGVVNDARGIIRVLRLIVRDDAVEL